MQGFAGRANDKMKSKSPAKRADGISITDIKSVKSNFPMKNNKPDVLKELKRRAIDVTSDVISAPERAYHGLRRAVGDMKYQHVMAQKNFKNRKDNKNYYKDSAFWARQK